MCDLIDLNSPNVRGASELPKLVSPLIPAPSHIRQDKANTQPEKREDDDNNPFDQVLHETAEYVSKKGDPFEVMLQQALKSKTWKKKKPVSFADDFTPKSKKRYFKTMNKTLNMLDESLLENRFGLFDGNKKETMIKTETIDRKYSDVCDNNVAANTSITRVEINIFAAESNCLPETLESSILNQSAMNDTLLESFPMCKKSNKMPFSEKHLLFEEEYTFPLSNIKHIQPHSQRSLSQGAEKSPLKSHLLCPKRARSVADDQRTVSQSSVSSLDKAFLGDKLSEQSVFSSLSNVSSITKSSTFLSNNTMNHAFLDNDSMKTSQEKITAAESSAEIKPKFNLSDLTERFNKLKFSMNDTNISSIKDGSDSTKEEDNKENKNNKLIDVDIFMPEENETFNTSSSTTSSDSVFFTNKFDKSILSEAKVLAKTFEELSSKPDSWSTDDDLLSNNTLWMLELLPAFEEIPVADNLIELPVSPEGNLKDITNDDKKQSSANTDNVDENLFKKLESPFTDDVAVKQDVTSLLSSLRKIIKTENNTEAKKLLDNLENILDVNYKNNTELLVTYLNTSNKSRSSQEISLEKFNNVSIDKSKEESGKITPQEKVCNNEKSDLNNALEAVSRDFVNNDKSSVTSLFCEDKDENHADRSNTSNSTKHDKHAEENDNHVDKKIAVELLINLKKLLNGQAKDDTTMELLKNIGKALKIALNNNIENEIQTNCIVKQNVQQTTPIRTSESNCNLVKVTRRRSVESKPKSFEKIVRKSVSTIELLPKSKSSTLTRGRTDTSEVENRQKIFLCDLGLAESTVSDSKKEKLSIMSDVKNKLKKRSDVINKKGPMKAMHPVNDMQKKRASLGKKTLSSQISTSPKSNKTTPLGNKIISSTPNSDNYITKKGTKSKPIASSTPDGQNSKNTLSTSNIKKRNFSCDISPVTAYVNMNGSDERKDSSKKMSKLPTPKKCTTPTRQRMDANSIPKFLTPPRNYSSLNTDRLNKSFNFQRYSPISSKTNVTKTQQSPLKESNRISAKVKPFNLISKIKRHSTSDFTEKENNY